MELEHVYIWSIVQQLNDRISIGASVQNQQGLDALGAILAAKDFVEHCFRDDYPIEQNRTHTLQDLLEVAKKLVWSCSTFCELPTNPLNVIPVNYKNLPIPNKHTGMSETVTKIEIKGNVLYYTDENYNVTAINLPLNLTSLKLEGNTLIYTDENGRENKIELVVKAECCFAIRQENNKTRDVVIFDRQNGTNYRIPTEELLTALSWDQTKRILRYVDEKGQSHEYKLEDTLTKLESPSDPKDVNKLYYTDENGKRYGVTINPFVTELKREKIFRNSLNDSNGRVDTEDPGTSGRWLTYLDENSDKWYFDITDVLRYLKWNQDKRTISFKDGFGVEHEFEIKESLTKLILEGNTLKYEDESGKINEIVMPVGKLTIEQNTLKYEDEAKKVTTISMPLTSLRITQDNEIVFRDEDGKDNIVPMPLTSLVLGGNTLTYTDEKGIKRAITLPMTSLRIIGNQLEYIDENGDKKMIQLPKTELIIEKNALRFTDEDGVAHFIPLPRTSLVLQGSKLVYTDELGNEIPIQMPKPTMRVSGNKLIFEYGGDETELDFPKETITEMRLVGGKTGMLAYTNEAGETRQFDVSDKLTKLEIAADNPRMLIYTDEEGKETKLVLDDSHTSLRMEGNILIYTDEKNSETRIDLSSLAGSGGSGSTGGVTKLPAGIVTDLKYDSKTGKLTYTDGVGSYHEIVLPKYSLKFDSTANTLAFSDGTILNSIKLPVTKLTYDVKSQCFVYTDELQRSSYIRFPLNGGGGGGTTVGSSLSVEEVERIVKKELGAFETKFQKAINTINSTLSDHDARIKAKSTYDDTEIQKAIRDLALKCERIKENYDNLLALRKLHDELENKVDVSEKELSNMDKSLKKLHDDLEDRVDVLEKELSNMDKSLRKLHDGLEAKVNVLNRSFRREDENLRKAIKDNSSEITKIWEEVRELGNFSRGKFIRIQEVLHLIGNELNLSPNKVRI